jgi:outer membrane protein assembly factor BamE (lipoprotein component of BamABCDE complex)
MKSPSLKLLLAFAAVVALGHDLPGVAADRPEPGQLEKIHYGLTQDQVRDLAGDPQNTAGDVRTGGAGEWIYLYTDELGRRSECDVTFDDNGLVTGTVTEVVDD